MSINFFFLSFYISSLSSSSVLSFSSSLLHASLWRFALTEKKKCFAFRSCGAFLSYSWSMVLPSCRLIVYFHYFFPLDQERSSLFVSSSSSSIVVQLLSRPETGASVITVVYNRRSHKASTFLAVSRSCRALPSRPSWENIIIEKHISLIIDFIKKFINLIVSLKPGGREDVSIYIGRIYRRSVS